MINTLILIYFVVWVALALVTFFLMRGRDPGFKQLWHPRVALFNCVVIGGFILLILAMSKPPFLVFLLFALLAVFITYANLQSRVCGKCGKLVQAQKLVHPPQFCPKCGGKIEKAA